MTAWKNRRERSGKGERGVAVIEFAIACTIMVTMLFGILSYGEVLAQYIQLRYAVGEISRQVAVGEDAPARQTTFDSLRPQMVAAFRSDAITATCARFDLQSEGAGSTAKVVIRGEYTLSDACRIMPAILPLPDDLSIFNRFPVLGVAG